MVIFNGRYHKILIKNCTHGGNIATLDIFYGEQLNTHAQGHNCACPSHKGGVSTDTKIRSPHRIAFSAEKRRNANLRHADTRSIPFFASIRESDSNTLYSYRISRLKRCVNARNRSRCTPTYVRNRHKVTNLLQNRSLHAHYLCAPRITG